MFSATRRRGNRLSSVNPVPPVCATRKPSARDPSVAVTGVAGASHIHPGIGKRGGGRRQPAGPVGSPTGAYIPRPVEQQLGLAAVIRRAKQRQRSDDFGGYADDKGLRQGAVVTFRAGD